MSRPDPGTVYRDDTNRVLMFVRTEQRPGAKEPEHLFVSVQNRVVLQRWLDEAPDEAKLVIDTEGRKQANGLRWLLEAAEHERDILLTLLSQACAWLPEARAMDLRRAYAASQP